MRLSIFTTSTRPIARGDLFSPSIDCYQALADEVVEVRGSGNKDTINLDGSYRSIRHRWPKEFDWPFIGEQFQRGYEAAIGDWVIHADLDFIFHEQDYDKIRRLLSQSDAPAMTFFKKQFILPDRYNVKSRLMLAVNKAKYGDRIKFNGGSDLCQPTLDGKLIEIDSLPKAEVAFYNYEKILKTREQIADDCGRMERAYKRHFGTYQMGSDGDDWDAYRAYMYLILGRFNKPQERIKLSDHPKVMQETIANLTLANFGYSGFGLLGLNDYAKINAIKD